MRRVQFRDVGCATCHRGVAIPKLLPDILTETVNKQGAATAVQQYRDLRKQYYGGQSYDFSENALVPVALQLTNANKPDDALAFLQLNAEYYPNHAPTYGGMGQAYLKKNDKETWTFFTGDKASAPKVGDKVTVYYRMVAQSVEVKPGKKGK